MENDLPPSPIKPEDATTAEGQNTVLSLLQQIKSGAIDAKNIRADDRRACVAHLAAEGFSSVEIAEVLKVSERTVARDRKENQKALALNNDPDFPPQMAGRLLAEAENCIMRIRRVTRDQRVPAATRVDGEHRCWLILRDCIDRLQKLGYLPTAAQRLEADLIHHLNGPPDIQSINLDIENLQKIQQQCRPEDTELHRQLLEASQQIKQLDICSGLAQIKQTLTKEPISDDRTAN